MTHMTDKTCTKLSDNPQLNHTYRNSKEIFVKEKRAEQKKRGMGIERERRKDKREEGTQTIQNAKLK